MCIDHLIPEYLAEKLDELAAVLASAGREPGWSLTATHNLVPSCRGMNARKHGRVLEPNEMIILLDQARGKVAEVARLQRKYETDMRTGMLRAQLAVALSNGRISEAEVGGILAGAAAGEDLVRLTSGLEIFDGVAVDQLRPSAAEELLDKPVTLGMDASRLLLVSDEGDAVEVRTSREYRAARDAGYYGNNTFHTKMEAYFITASNVIEALAACRPSSRSFMRAPPIGACDIHLLPSSVLITFEEENREVRDRLIAEFPTVAGLVRADQAEIAWADSMFISIDFLGIRTSLQEMLRADLDGDGVEELLAAVYFNAEGGTLGAGMEPVALARKGFAEPFTVTEMVPFPVTA